MLEGPPVPPPQPDRIVGKPDVKIIPALEDTRIYARAMSSTLRQAVREGNEHASGFLAEFIALQEKYPDLFPRDNAVQSSAAPFAEPSSLSTAPVTERVELPAVPPYQSPAEEHRLAGDAALVQPVDVQSMASLAQVGQAETTAVQTATEEVSDAELAKSYPVTEQSKQIIGELKEIEDKAWKLSGDDLKQARQRQEELRRQLSDELRLPAGRNAATLEAEIAMVEEVEHESMTIGKAIGGKLYTNKLEVLMQQASPEIQEAYSKYRSTVAELTGYKDWEKRSAAERAFEEACDNEIGITNEERLKEFATHGVVPVGLHYESVEKVQAETLRLMWRQIENAKIAQSVYTRRETFLQGLAAKADLVIYKTQLGYDTKPLASGKAPESAATPESAHILVREAIKEWLHFSDKTRYDSDNLRSPTITENTFAAALPDSLGLVVDRTGYGEIGKGALGTVYKGKARGGIPGLRGEGTASSEQEPVVLKAPTIDSRVSLDYRTAQDVLNSIEEAYVLDLIRITQKSLYPGTRPFVPDSVLLQNYRGAPALVMEYVDHEYDIYRQRDTLTPEQLRSASVQYFQLQDVIHTAGFTCNDVKGGDFFYKPEEDRLIVLDWNVTKPIKSPPERIDIEKMNTDLLIGLKYFGQDMAQRWTSEARDVMRSLESRI